MDFQTRVATLKIFWLASCRKSWSETRFGERDRKSSCEDAVRNHFDESVDDGVNDRMILSGEQRFRSRGKQVKLARREREREREKKQLDSRCRYAAYTNIWWSSSGANSRGPESFFKGSRGEKVAAESVSKVEPPNVRPPVAYRSGVRSISLFSFRASSRCRKRPSISREIIYARVIPASSLLRRKPRTKCSIAVIAAPSATRPVGRVPTRTSRIPGFCIFEERFDISVSVFTWDFSSFRGSPFLRCFPRKRRNDRSSFGGNGWIWYP